MRVAGKFGRLPPLSRIDSPRVFTEDYVDYSYRTYLPKPSPSVSRIVSSWPMYLNDKLGDCTEAGKAHMAQAISAYGSGKEITVTDNSVLSWYERDGGYVPGKSSTDNGCVMQSVLQNWQSFDNFCPISEFAETKEFYQIPNLKESLYLFGSVYLGINLPGSAMDQFNNGEPWTYVPGSSIAGGHAIVLQEIAAPGEDDMLHVVTWGSLQKMSREFFWHYCEEAWVVLSPEWFNNSGVDTDGFDLPALQADFAQLTSTSN